MDFRHAKSWMAQVVGGGFTCLALTVNTAGQEIAKRSPAFEGIHVFAHDMNCRSSLDRKRSSKKANGSHLF